MDFEQQITRLAESADIAKQYNRNLMHQIDNQLLDVRLSTHCLQDGIPLVNNDPNEFLYLSASQMKKSRPNLTKEISRHASPDLNKTQQCPEPETPEPQRIVEVAKAPFYSYINSEKRPQMLVSDISVKNGLNFEMKEPTTALERSQIKSTVSKLNGRDNYYFEVFSSPKCRKSAKLVVDGYSKVGLSMGE